MSIQGNNLLAQYYAQNQGLPDGYEAVEYLESTGEQLINTNIPISNIRNKTLKIQCEVQGTTQKSTTQIIIGLSSYGGGWFGIPSNSNNYGLSTNILFSNTITEKVFVESVFTLDSSWNISETCSLNVGSILTRSGTIPTTQRNNYVALLSTTSQNIWQFFASVKLYKTQKIYLDNSLIRNFIPCVRKSDGKPGLYDLCRSICPLTGTPFYINSGTGEFVTP